MKVSFFFAQWHFQNINYTTNLFKSFNGTHIGIYNLYVNNIWTIIEFEINWLISDKLMKIYYR